MGCYIVGSVSSGICIFWSTAGRGSEKILGRVSFEGSQAEIPSTTKTVMRVFATINSQKRKGRDRGDGLSPIGCYQSEKA